MSSRNPSLTGPADRGGRAVLRSLLILVLVVAAGVVARPGAGLAADPPLPRTGPDRAFVTPSLDFGEAGISQTSKLCQRLRNEVRRGNGSRGLMIRNLRTGKVVCGFNARRNLSLASNTKLFTTSAALARLGPGYRFRTRLFSVGRIDRSGTLHGNLFLKGGGDPALGTRAFQKSYLGGAGAPIERLAARAKAAGLRKVTGRLIGDETVFDGLRGVADSGYATSPWIGPLSGLSFNAGFTDSSRARFSSNPARLATVTLEAALKRQGIKIARSTRLKRTPPANKRRLVAEIFSPKLAWITGIVNLNSNNFFAEMTAKNLGATQRKRGTTRNGTIVMRRHAAAEGVEAHPVDGSGLTRSNRSSAAGVARLLMRSWERPWGQVLLGSLPIGGVSGTLASRMRGSKAEGRCHAKTGTLTGVSSLSGYCLNRSGRRYAFSILMNGVYDSYAARAAQDRIAAIVAGF